MPVTYILAPAKWADQLLRDPAVPHRTTPFPMSVGLYSVWDEFEELFQPVAESPQVAHEQLFRTSPVERHHRDLGPLRLLPQVIQHLRATGLE